MTSRRLIRIKVLQLLYSYLKQDGLSIVHMENTLLSSMEKSTDLYYITFRLLSDIKHHMFIKMDVARNKRFASEDELHPNLRFIENPIFKLIEDHKTYQSYINNHGMTWDDMPEIIDALTRCVEEFEPYKLYMGKAEVTFEDHKQVLLDILVDLIAQNELYFQTLEDKNIYWNDDYELVLGIAYKTIKNMKITDTVDKRIFYPIFNGEEDYSYAKMLLRRTLNEYQENLTIVDKFTRNWEIERISDIDKLIMIAAITELKTFPSIPVKVTLDEFIEISKTYSSPKSSSFINGILDKAVSTLKEENKIEKLGRGLIEKSSN